MLKQNTRRLILLLSIICVLDKPFCVFRAEAATNKRRVEAVNQTQNFRSEIASESADIDKELADGGFAPGAPF